MQFQQAGITEDCRATQAELARCLAVSDIGVSFVPKLRRSNAGRAVGRVTEDLHLSKQGCGMHWREEAIHERDVIESRSFLIGLGNGICMSALVTLALYWLIQGVL